MLALVLAILCFPGVPAFHFPEYPTTPELRKSYSVDLMRSLLYGAMVAAGGLALLNIVLWRAHWLALGAFALVALSALLGGHQVPVNNDFADHTPYIGLDWFILDLLGSSRLFIFIEKRFGWAAHDGVRGWVQGLNFFVALFLIVLVADLVQYWTHRAYHEVPRLWRLHAVHHSVKSMDWLAGSRQHVVELLITRTPVLAPICVLGSSKEVIDAYIVIVGFQAVFNHANVSVRLGPLRDEILAPNFHHWHHAQHDEAIDRNHAAHLAFLDHLFGTAVQSDREWPECYGVQGDNVPDGFFRQLAFPFVWRG